MAIQKRLLCHYHYDPLDRLIASGIRTRAEHPLFYRGKRLAGESRGGLYHAFLHAADRPVAQFIHSGKAVDATLLATDAPGSVLHALTRGQRQAQAYAVYGYHAPGGGLDSLLGFNGERRDPVTGHYLLGQGYRAYNPVLMRFNSPDRLSPFGGGGLNAYGYCQGNPINLVDPDGHMAMVRRLSLGAMVGALGISVAAIAVGTVSPESDAYKILAGLGAALIVAGGIGLKLSSLTIEQAHGLQLQAFDQATRPSLFNALGRWSIGHRDAPPPYEQALLAPRRLSVQSSSSVWAAAQTQGDGLPSYEMATYFSKTIRGSLSFSNTSIRETAV
ncbi:RHS repeat-associated core domain-containing protein [uncultured Pseudomonas sp.]|uniref:RHS repeat-associated core domain-containing protein n=1 Tax=uncultured Pseudomonas sp. TaxID=114707 RepID=UPI0025F7A3E0|nr:RHS repeat-associated core domain-containing protein [uncultured Pseudomonas sp.]